MAHRLGSTAWAASSHVRFSADDRVILALVLCVFSGGYYLVVTTVKVSVQIKDFLSWQTAITLTGLQVSLLQEMMDPILMYTMPKKPHWMRYLCSDTVRWYMH